jgi:uncharacterized protein
MTTLSRRSLFGAVTASASAAVATALAAAPALAQDLAAPRRVPSSDYRPPADVDFRVVNIISEGVRLHGELFRAHRAAEKLPTVLMAHGWGGTAAAFRPDAVDLARAGFLVLTFDYRGWGESDARVVPAGAEPPGAGDDVFTAEVKALRGYVDPFEQVADWFNAIDWLAGEPAADMTRLGLRGSSYSGGHVIYIAARDARIRALVSQVGGIADRPETPPADGGRPFAQAERRMATAMARGDAGYPPPFAKFGKLVGEPVGDKLLRWWPNADAPFVRAAALFVLAGNDGLIDNSKSGERAYERVQGPKKLVVIPGITHFQIYGPYREQAIQLAIDWFKEHLA